MKFTIKEDWYTVIEQSGIYSTLTFGPKRQYIA